MTVSSNFEHFLSASVWYLLPFLWLRFTWLCWTSSTTFLALPCHLIMGWRLLKHPHKWEAKSITRFMIWMGPISSAFDILTFILLYFVIVPMATGRPMLTGRVCNGLYYFVPDRLVHWIHVVPNHGYPYAPFSKTSFLTKSSIMVCSWDNL